MSWMGQIGNILEQYAASASGAAAQPAQDVGAHYEQVAQAAPQSALAEGLAAAFRSNATPELGQMVSSLFSSSNGDQKAGVLNELMSHVDPATMSQILSSAGLGNLAGTVAGGAGQISPTQAQQIPPEVVQQIAAEAQKVSPGVVDSLSNFYAQHSTLVKTLGGAALSIAMAKIAERQRQG